MDINEQRAWCEDLARRGQLSAEGLELALGRLGCLPDTAAWRLFADRLLLVLGSLLLLAGAVFFFAFNWQGFHRLQKLALVAAPLLASSLAAWRLGLERGAGQACLGAAAVLTGVFLAVAGQIYQSGADSELLFFAWAVLILPWVLVARAPWLWLFWLLLGNVALVLYIAGRLDVLSVLLSRDGLYWLPLLFNGLALAAWEAGWGRLPWLQAGYGPRFLALLSGLAATGLGISWWWQDGGLPWTPLVYGAWWLVLVIHYQKGRRDIVPLAVAALSGICVLVAGVLRHLHFRESMAGNFLLLAGLVAGLTAVAALWLRRTSAAWEEA